MESWSDGNNYTALDGTAVSQNGWTPLIAASHNGRLEVVGALLAAGADKEAKDEVGGC